jgi:hypothetical protein
MLGLLSRHALASSSPTVHVSTVARTNALYARETRAFCAVCSQLDVRLVLSRQQIWSSEFSAVFL